jgi:hypothetical protein
MTAIGEGVWLINRLTLIWLKARHILRSNLNSIWQLCRAITIMTSRMQISLDLSLRLRAFRKASKQGVSMAEFVRRAIERDLEAPSSKPDVSVIFGIGRSKEPTNIALNKNTMIAESLESKVRR